MGDQGHRRGRGRSRTIKFVLDVKVSVKRKNRGPKVLNRDEFYKFSDRVLVDVYKSHMLNYSKLTAYVLVLLFVRGSGAFPKTSLS